MRGDSVIPIVCIANNNGMLFNMRRCSRDSVLIEKLLEMIGGEEIMIAPYSKELFGEEKVVEDSDFLIHAGKGDYCFVENVSLKDFAEKIEKVIICRWNRDYPADFFFDLDMADFHLKGTMMEFQGSSHERITIEEWVKNEKEA